MTLIIGPLPDPIDGCSIANFTLCKNLDKRNIKYQTINTNTKIVSSKQGNTFSLKKAISFFKVYLEVYKIFSSTIIYTTPGQTFFGILKYSPFYILCKLLRKPYVILFLSNLIAEKGILDVLDALIILKNTNITFKAYLAGKMESEFEKVINEKLQLIGDSVEYLGIINGDKKYEVLNSANIFLLPTYYKMEG